MNSKISIFLTWALFFPVSIFAQNVSTNLQKRNALLEEFTGIHCGNCPDGHRIANNLVAAQPEKVYTIAIHSGYYAIPGTGEPDYRIPEGEAIDDYYHINSQFGYPAGIVSRKAVTLNGTPQATVISRSNWVKSAKTVTGEDAPVNLWLNADYDGGTRLLNINVEAYYTAQVNQSENFLHVVITQTDITGPQGGGNVGDNYLHRHQLKALVTPLWGDTLFNPTQGQLITKNYTFTLPEAVNNIPVLAENCEALVFITASKDDVLNITGKKPSYINCTNALNAILSAPKEGIAQRHAFRFFDIDVKNKSHFTLNTAEFRIAVGSDLQTVTWNGAIGAYATETVRLNLPTPFTPADNNAYEIKLLSLNGTTLAGNSVTGALFKPLDATTKVTFEIQTDVYADENRYLLREENGDTVHIFGGYPAGQKTIYYDTLNLQPNKTYCFEVVDAWSDGVAGSSYKYKIRNDNGSLVAQVFDLSSYYGDRTFFTTSSPLGIGNIANSDISNFKIGTEKDNTISVIVQPQISNLNYLLTIYNIAGQKIHEQRLNADKTRIDKRFPAGIYFVKIFDGKNQQVKKVVLK
jgi:hypothetical protein